MKSDKNVEDGDVFHIRQAELSDVSGIARVHVESWRSTYTGLMAEEIITKLNYTFRENQWRRTLSAHSTRRCQFVAENGSDGIVGFASGGPETGGYEGFDGELYAIYILEENQGRGIGKRLTEAVAKCLLKKGMNSMLVWVLSTNPYRRFYESLGAGKFVEKDEVYAGATLHVSAYGWKDIDALIAGLET